MGLFVGWKEVIVGGENPIFPKYPTMNHVVAIFGRAVSGAEAAYQLTKNAIQVVVFDQI